MTVQGEEVWARTPMLFNGTLLNLLRGIVMGSDVDMDGSVIEEAQYMPTGSGSLGCAFVWIVVREGEGRRKRLFRVVVEEVGEEYVLRLRGF